MSDLDHWAAKHFNYWDEVRPAMTDFTIEASMVTKLMRLEKISLKRAMQLVNDIVHVAKHYTVVDKPTV